MVEKYSGRQNHYGFASNGSKATINPPASTSSVVQSPLRAPIMKAHPQKEQSSGAWKVADKAQHTKWGIGTVIEVKGSGDSQELKIAFPGLGIKLVVANMAPITKV
jgi:DNA helicase-2/ATP-dependent DNA helicase PcrA